MSWLDIYSQKPPQLEKVEWGKLPLFCFSPHAIFDLEILRQFKAIDIFSLKSSRFPYFTFSQFISGFQASSK